jgi:8-oxo-dGTP pyrophosphatase MutT (NUDIX family)
MLIVIFNTIYFSMTSGKKIAAGVLPICTKTGRILLVRRGFNQPSPGLWAGFGGKMEPEDSNPQETAKREFKEESQYEGEYRISKEPVYVNRDNHLDFYTYIGLFDEEFVPELGPAEEAIDYGWFYLYEMPESVLPNMQKMFDLKSKSIENIICKYSGFC